MTEPPSFWAKCGDWAKYIVGAGPKPNYAATVHKDTIYPPGHDLKITSRPRPARLARRELNWIYASEDGVTRGNSKRSTLPHLGCHEVNVFVDELKQFTDSKIKVGVVGGSRVIYGAVQDFDELRDKLTKFFIGGVSNG